MKRRYVVLGFAVLFLASGLVQAVLRLAIGDAIGLVGGIVQLIVGTALLLWYIRWQKRATRLKWLRKRKEERP